MSFKYILKINSANVHIQRKNKGQNRKRHLLIILSLWTVPAKQGQKSNEVDESVNTLMYFNEQYHCADTDSRIVSDLSGFIDDEKHNSGVV